MNARILNAVEHPELGLCRRPNHVDVPAELVAALKTMSAAIKLCIQLSGLESKEIYGVLGIDSGHWSKMLSGDAHFPHDKLMALMDLCGNEVPLLFLASARGYGLVMLKSEAERRAEEAEARAAEAEKKLAWAMEVMRGKV